MRAFILEKYNKIGALRQVEMAQPVAGPNEVLVRIHAAAINPLDNKISTGEFKAFMPYKLPTILGHDMAGTILSVGSKVINFAPGDEVYARPRDQHIGTFAEFIAVNAADLALKPKNISMEEAAAIPLIGLTAWQALVELGSVRAGQKVFIQAGSGGVGSFAIQLAKHLGATVATTVSAKNIPLAKGLGADVVIDYKTEDFETILADYDFVLHSQDVKMLEKSLKILRPGGRLISISGPPDQRFARALKLNGLMRFVIWTLSKHILKKANDQGVQYSFLFMRANGGQLDHITKLIEDGVISPIIDSVFPFSKLPEALAYVDKGRTRGKVAIKIVE